MAESGSEAYPNEPVPPEARGSSIPLFFIVTGTLCGFPVLLLSGGVVRSLGCSQAILAFFIGAAIAGVLGGLTSLSGSLTGYNTAMLAERAFGIRGSLLVKGALSLCLIGWYVVIASLLGDTVSRLAHNLWSASIDPTLLSAIAVVSVGCIVAAGVRGLEWLGFLLVPLTAALLIWAGVRTLGHWQAYSVNEHVYNFGSAIGAVIGIYIVGIVIQPDFGRFVRRPRNAALASGTALALAYPAILSLAGLAAIGLKAASVVDGLAHGIAGNVVVIVIVGGALIDSSLSLYAGSVGLANLLRLRSNRVVIAVATLGGVLFTLIPTDGLFIQYLTVLGVALPPLAVAIIGDFWLGPKPRHETAIRTSTIFGWAAGATAGILSTYGNLALTRIPSIDSILVCACTISAWSAFQRMSDRRVQHAGY